MKYGKEQELTGKQAMVTDCYYLFRVSPTYLIIRRLRGRLRFGRHSSLIRILIIEPARGQSRGGLVPVHNIRVQVLEHKAGMGYRG